MGGDGVQGGTSHARTSEQEDHPKKLLRNLHNQPTDADQRLWQHLRGRQLEDCKFRRQHPFGDYILDFACLEPEIVIELDGGQHAQDAAYDARRTECLDRAGFKVPRFWNNEVFENIEGVRGMIITALTLASTPSPPNPPLEGEG